MMYICLKKEILKIELGSSFLWQVPESGVFPVLVTFLAFYTNSQAFFRNNFSGHFSEALLHRIA